MKIKTYLLVFFALLLISSLPIILLGSTTVTKLEHKIIEESQNRITSITHTKFGEYGRAVLGKDQTGGGKIFELVRIPGTDRYWVSETRNYTADQNYEFAAQDLKQWVLLHLDHGIISVENSKTGFGYLGIFFMRILIAAGFASIGALIIDKRIRKKNKALL